MRLPNILLLIALIIAASTAEAQQFKVLKDTVDYKLMEVDSGYFYSHGIEKNKDFVADTNKFVKKNGILKLPLLNGKTIELHDSLVNTAHEEVHEYFYVGQNKKLEVYFVGAWKYEWGEFHQINQRNGYIDTLEGMPEYSPNYKFYAYGEINFLNDRTGVTYKNLKTNKVVNVDAVNSSIRGYNWLKWIDDYSFICWIKKYNIYGSMFLGNKYYLVQIKK